MTFKLRSIHKKYLANSKISSIKIVYVDNTYVPNYNSVQRYICVHITLAYMTLLLSTS